MNYGRTPGAVFGVVQTERDNVRVFGQNGMHSFAELPGALSVNNPHLKNPVFPTSGQVIRHQLAHIARIEGVQVQHSVDR
jgi:hypothetical protein